MDSASEQIIPTTTTTRYFIAGETFAAPFFSERISTYVEAATPEAALEQLSEKMRAELGLYAACAYPSADAYHEGKEPLARWLSNHEIAKQEATRDLGGYSYLGEGAGRFRINETWYQVEDPRGGRVVPKDEASK